MMRQFMVEACRRVMSEVEVYTAATVATALDLLRHPAPPDVVMLDLILPDGCGLEVAAQARRSLPNTKIIVVSSCLDEFTLHRVMEIGVDGFIDKLEQTFEAVCEAIRSVLSGKVYFSPTARRVHAQLRADPLAFTKLISNRELEMLTLFGRGLSNEEIARDKGLSPSTVRNHRQNIMGKLGLSSTTQLIRYALEKGFVRPG